MGCLNITAERIGCGLDVQGLKAHGGLLVSASMVCEVNIKFVKVSKTYIWLVPANQYSEDVDVLSNVNWSVL